MKNELTEIENYLNEEANAILDIPIDQNIIKTVQLLYEYIHLKGGKIILSGMGKAGQIALNIATTFSSTGSPAVFLHPSEAQHGDVGIITKKDVLILISNSGKTREIIELREIALNLYSNLPIILITSNTSSSLSATSNIVVNIGKSKELCPYDLTPSISTTKMTVIGDILVVLLMKKIKFSKEDYAKRHHGGYLGHKSRN